MSIKSVCVFCGSNRGDDATYIDAAIELGHFFVDHGINLVYGGGSVGLMGVIADAVLQRGGKVTGVIPKHLARKEVMHKHVEDLQIVDSMHERKQRMYELSDAFVALPGGLGTFEELCEILTWSQLGLHQKPIGILNVRSFFSSFISQLDHAASQGFLKKEHRNLLLVADSISELFSIFKTFSPRTTGKWLDIQDT